MGPGQYIESIQNQAALRRPLNTLRPQDWFDIFVEARAQTRVVVTISDQAAQLTGNVARSGNPIAGAPVFLWPTQENPRRSLHGYRTVLSDTTGHFKFESLPPGDYRIFSSFDFYEIDEEAVELAQAIAVRAEVSKITSVDLPLWIAP